jgi:hypothetical protein
VKFYIAVLSVAAVISLPAIGEAQQLKLRAVSQLGVVMRLS